MFLLKFLAVRPSRICDSPTLRQRQHGFDWHLIALPTPPQLQAISIRLDFFSRSIVDMSGLPADLLALSPGDLDLHRPAETVVHQLRYILFEALKNAYDACYDRCVTEPE